MTSLERRRSPTAVTALGFMDRSRRKLFLLAVCLITLLIGYAIRSHKSSKTKVSSQTETGIKALTNPEALVKDLVE